MAGTKKRLRENGIDHDEYAASDEGGDSDGSVDVPRPAGSLGRILEAEKKKDKKQKKKKSKNEEASSLGEAMRAALARHVPATSATPILAGAKKNKEMEQAIQEEKEEKETAKLAVAKKKWFQKEHLLPDIMDKNRERMLLSIATKGTVQLFNAVQKQQKVRQEQKGRDVIPAKPDKMTKGQFLDMLKGKKQESGSTQDDQASNRKQGDDEDDDFDDDDDDAGGDMLGEEDDDDDDEVHVTSLLLDVYV
jgi:hypothetical protein